MNNEHKSTNIHGIVFTRQVRNWNGRYALTSFRECSKEYPRATVSLKTVENRE